MTVYSFNGQEYKFNANIHPSVKIPRPDLVHIYGGESTIIEENCLIGPFVEIQKNVKIGKNSRIQSHSFLCDGTEIKENVFIGHGVVTINDLYPKNNNKEWIPLKTIINKNASIGSNVTLFPVTIGENCIIGAGSVVTKDIPNNLTAYGNPAKIK